MAYQRPDRAFIDYRAYRWGRLGQLYRGPQPDLSQPYIACIGGAQTFGRYVERPYPAILSGMLGRPVANFGAADAGPEFYLRDSMVLEALCRAELVVVQAMSAQALSNRLYQVRPRRNLQISAVSPALRRLYPPAVDSACVLANTLLDTLAADHPDGFAAVEAELKTAWVARMRRLLQSIHTRKLLLWFSERQPDEAEASNTPFSLRKYPQHVDQAMLDALRPEVDDIVYCVTDAGMPQSLLVDGAPVMQDAFGLPVRENRNYPSPEMHCAAAEALAPAAGAALSMVRPAGEASGGEI